jgi:ABC-2 type transport system ATP-binding protein
MQQKVQFIVTIVHEPKFIIFDEPFSGFDPLNATLLKDEILNLNAQGATIIFSTHNMTSVEEMCTDIALINRSLKILEGKVSDIKQQYKDHQFEIHLLNAANQIEVLRVQADPGISTNALLQKYMTAGQIVKFEEILPSMNDIFIRQVKQNS